VLLHPICNSVDATLQEKDVKGLNELSFKIAH
jgi:hypothetical protein